MFEFLFDCSAFELSTTTQLLNNILFPVALFLVIFWLMCEIFLVDDNLPIVDEEFTSGIVKTQIDEDIIDPEDESSIEKLFSNMAATSDEKQSKTALFDIDREGESLKALGVRQLRDFCKNRKIKGYAAIYNQRGIDGLVEFLLQQQIYARNIEQQVEHVEISA
ncbi:hypothetical protein [Brunnivagina elsteri]|uniref:Uncharacterized protein n=1 Tax=Brunnivagina elsteri CCALA 953 TaxID=987040 RepID=A0A2A2TB55_9CYAN|nr:hypothetical protein [Calothrix elsteri]PAX51027.1 hypothetical protein CK510_27060 [Calothrix elsteri CCALA 953]